MLYKKLFNSVLILLFFICSSCQGLNFSNINGTPHHSYGENSIIVASLEDNNIYHDEISGVVIDKKETKKSKRKWLWVAVTIILVVVTITAITIIDDDNGGDSGNKGDNGIETDDITDFDVNF